MNVRSKKILIYISGGVDSTYCAYLLAQKGAHVELLYFRTWLYENNNFFKCSWNEDLKNLKKLSTLIKAPYHVMNYIKVYKNFIVSNLLNLFSLGYIPNPDIYCNKYIKFYLLIKLASKRGFLKVVAGHYAKIIKKNRVYSIYKSNDQAKDQTYFLSFIKNKYLKFIFLPLGFLKKKWVRFLSMYNNLSTFNRRDSQGLCFLKNIKFVDFLKIYLNSYLSTIHLFKFYKLKLSFIKDLNYFPVGFKINTLFLRFKDLKLGFCRFYSSYYSYKKIIYIHTINMQLYFQKKRAYFLSGKFRSFRDFLRIKLFLNGFRTGYFFLKKKIKPLLNSGQVLALYRNNRLVGGGIFF